MKRPSTLFLTLGTFVILAGVIYNVLFINAPKDISLSEGKDQALHSQVTDYILWGGVAVALIGVVLYIREWLANRKKTG